ncbi:MAG TPA: aspartyl protease family protein [Sediminibacterium sp.]|nr:aspartyl protease family protein [Sediminibacterium sp.]
MKRWRWLALVVLTAMKAAAQEEFIQPESRLIARFPFMQLNGGIVIVHARLDQVPDTLNFVMDTGSGGISLDSSTRAYLSLPVVKTEKTIRGIGGIRTVDFVMDRTLLLPGLTVPHLDFHINDYSLLTSVYGVRIDGIIGYSFFRRFIVRLDYDNQRIEVFTPGTFKYPRGGYLLRPSFSTLPLQTAILRDERTIFSRFIFDTGAGLSCLLSQDFVEDSLPFKRNRKFFLTQAEGMGGKRQMKIGVAKEIRLGPYRFKKVPVHIFNDTYNVTDYPILSGLIGNDILRRFNVILNYPQQVIYIKPNSHFSEKFDYSYTGLGIYLVDGEIQVVDVMPGSPGDKAGFKPGDVIFSVEANVSRNIQAYKSLFQNSIGKVHVVIFRDQKPVVLLLDVKDIRRHRGD